jgi:hypothetical protein
MKKFFSMLFLTVTFAAVAGTAKDMPTPQCYPCCGGQQCNSN